MMENPKILKDSCMAASPEPKRATPEPTPGPTDFRRTAERLKQVSEPTRLRVLLRLGDGERSVGALRSEIAGGMTALSRHLALLRLAGLVVPRRDGQRNVYALTDAGRDLRRVLVGVVGGDAPRGVSRAGRGPASGQILTDAERPRRTEEPTKREEPTP
jgi:DNA-binding transcriptional ArsR family regulator